MNREVHSFEENFQRPIADPPSVTGLVRAELDFVVWNFFGVWSLVFGVWLLVFILRGLTHF
jgi:hypothetical protein